MMTAVAILAVIVAWGAYLSWADGQVEKNIRSLAEHPEAHLGLLASIAGSLKRLEFIILALGAAATAAILFR